MQRRGHPEHHRLGIVFLLKGAEQTVPDNEHPTVIAIHIQSILRMVSPMIGRCHKQPLEPAQLGHMAGMDPELIEQVDGGHGDKYRQRHTQHRHWQVKDPTKHKPGAGLAQGGGQVVVFALMMHRMRGPEHVALMPQAVVPVVAKIVEDKRKQPHPQAVFGQLQQRQIFQCQRVGDQPHAFGQQTGGGRQHTGAQAADSVSQAIGVHCAPAVGQQLDSNQHKEKRYGIQNQLHGTPRAVFHQA